MSRYVDQLHGLVASGVEVLLPFSHHAVPAVQVVDLDTGRPSTVHKSPVPVLCLAASPAADVLAVGMSDGAVSIHRRKQGSAARAAQPTRLR